MVFDDSYEHEVWNKTEEERVLLLVDFWHVCMEGCVCVCVCVCVLYGRDRREGDDMHMLTQTLIHTHTRTHTHIYIHTARDRACGTCGDPGDV